MGNPVITLDIDWAPDFAIDYVAEILAKAGVRATWFVTHPSMAIERLRERGDLFELGIHPNFLSNSTQGRDESAVLRYCMKLVPKARSMRTHGLFQTSNLLERIVNESPIETDVSLFLPHAKNLEPVMYYWPREQKLLRLPYFWEDDFESVRPSPCWSLEPYLEYGPGLKIFGFHPLHVYVNSASLEPYRQISKMGQLQSLDRAQVDPKINMGIGAGTIFKAIVEHLAGSGGATIGDIARLENIR